VADLQDLIDKLGIAIYKQINLTASNLIANLAYGLL